MEFSCDTCKYRDDCPESWFEAAGGSCENYEQKEGQG